MFNVKYKTIVMIAAATSLFALMAQADTPISSMRTANPLAGTELIPVVQGGSNAVTTPNAIKTFVGVVGGGGGGSGSVTNVSTGCGLAGGPVTATGTLSSSEVLNAQAGVSYSLSSSDCGTMLTSTNASSVSFSLLDPAVAGQGYWFDMENLGLGTVTLTPAVGLINLAGSLAVASSQGVHCMTDGSNYYCNVGTSGGTTVSGLFGNQAKNLIFSGPANGANSTPGFRPLTGADLPVPSSSTLGGVMSIAPVSHFFLTGINASTGAPSSGQPLCSDLSNGGTACASNIGTSGATVPLLNGNNNFSGVSTFSGALVVARRTVAINTTLSATTDQEVCPNITAGALTITMPPNPVNGARFMIVDCKRLSTTHAITIAANTGQTISGAANIIMSTSNGASVGLTWNSQDNDWNIH